MSKHVTAPPFSSRSPSLSLCLFHSPIAPSIYGPFSHSLLHLLFLSIWIIIMILVLRAHNGMEMWKNWTRQRAPNIVFFNLRITYFQHSNNKRTSDSRHFHNSQYTWHGNNIVIKISNFNFDYYYNNLLYALFSYFKPEIWGVKNQVKRSHKHGFVKIYFTEKYT